MASSHGEAEEGTSRGRYRRYRLSTVVPPDVSIPVPSPIDETSRVCRTDHPNELCGVIERGEGFGKC